MVAKTLKAVTKSLDAPDEVRQFGHGELRVVNLDIVTIGRVVLQPGWRWSKDIKPIANTETCQSQHVQYVIAGRLMVAMDDGTQLELKAGEAGVIPPGHDAWVVGDEPFIAVDFTGMTDYAKGGR